MFIDVVKKNNSCIIHTFGCLIIADFRGDLIELVEGDERFEKCLRVGQRFQFVVGSHHFFIRIAFDLFSAMVGNGFREEAGAVIVDVWIQVIDQETVDEGSMSLGNMSVSQMLADDRSILTLGEVLLV